MMRSLLLLLLILAGASFVPAQSVEFPLPPDGQVLDRGHWLGKERISKLESELGRFRELYDIDVRVVLWDRAVPSDTELPDLAKRLGETWVRSELWVIVLHVPESNRRPIAVWGGPASQNIMEGVPDRALHSATLRAFKERTVRSTIEALGLEAGQEFVFLKHRQELEQQVYIANRARQERAREGRDQALIFRAGLATMLALLAVAAVGVLYYVKRRPSNLRFPETRWRKRFGGEWSGGGNIVVSIPRTP